jgi:hypothetical protein
MDVDKVRQIGRQQEAEKSDENSDVTVTARSTLRVPRSR